MRLGIALWVLFTLLIVSVSAVEKRGIPPDSLNIIAIEPAETGWPVILVADYQGDPNDAREIIFYWTFPDDVDQSCTLRGNTYTHPCRGSVVEHTWGTEGLHQVTLTAMYLGGTLMEVHRTIRIENAYSGPVVARQEIRSLPLPVWTKIRDTIVLMKQKGIYDHLVFIHQVSSAYGVRQGSLRNQAHRGPAFPPWHRVYLRIFERIIQVLSGDDTLGLPYWDWTIDAEMDHPKRSPVWNTTYFGPDGDDDDDDVVPAGAFCSKPSRYCAGLFPVIRDLQGPYLTRELGVHYDDLPTARQVANILSVTTFDAEPYDDTVDEERSFRNALEGWPHNGDDRRHFGRAHNAVHDWVGGSMVPYTSANDPVFFFHHCQVDRIYYQWQVQTNCYAQCYTPRDHERSITERTPGAQWRHGEWRLPGHHWSDWMYPWWVRPRDVADAWNSLRGYYYA